MSISSARAILALGASTIALTSAPAAFAQDAQVGIGDIVVTAQRRAESINDVPMSIQAFGSESLEAMRVTDVKDLTAMVPSFGVNQSYQGVPTYTMRGIGFNTINLSATSTVGTYTDEVAYAYPIMNTGPMIDIERVEVLKGPQGTLYGRNTTAGLINFVTGKPKDVVEGMVTLEVGDYETVNVGGYITGPLADRLQVRLAFRADTSSEGWQKSNTTGQKLGKVSKYGLRGSVAFQPTDTTNIDASATYWINKSDTVAAQGIGFTPATTPGSGSTASLFNAPGLPEYIASNFPTRGNQADWQPRAEREQDIGVTQGIKGPLQEDNWFLGLKLRIEQEIGDTTRFVALTGYNEFRRDAVFDWSGAPYNILAQDAAGKIESFAQEARFEGENGPVNWLVGGYYAVDTIVDSNKTQLGDNANVALVRAGAAGLLNTPFNTGGYTLDDLGYAFRQYEDIGNFKTKTWSVFANADVELTPTLKATAGVRYTEDLQRYTGCSRDINGSMLPNVNVFNRALFFQVYGVLADPIEANQCNTFSVENGSFGAVQSTLDENNVAWRLAMNWQPNDTALLYASVSRGFKSGATPVNAASKAEQNAPVTQEKLTAYEVGTKLSLLDRRVQTNAAFFYYDYSDKQISTYFADPIYTALSRLDNVPDSHAYGFEADVTAQLIDGLTVSATALWLETKINGYIGTNAAGQTQNFDGAGFIYSPKFQGTVTALVDVPLTEGINFTAMGNVRHQSSSNTIFEDLEGYRIPAYALVNASIGLRADDASWAVNFWARNLFDRYYWSAATSNANTVVRFPGRTRTMGLTGTFRF